LETGLANIGATGGITGRCMPPVSSTRALVCGVPGLLTRSWGLA
jgi:hypothetical protein